jgi:outer membrane protein, adhesin transport system
VRRDLSNDVSRFWSQIETRRSRSGAWRDLLNQTEQVRENYWQQFTIGKRSILDLLNAENEAFQSRLSAEQERLETLQAQYRLLGSLARIGGFLGLRAANADLKQ